MATVNVRAKGEKGRWRAGRHWPHTPTDYDVDEATLAALKGDPQIVVREARGDAPPIVLTSAVALEAANERLAAQLAEARRVTGPSDLEPTLREAIARIDELEARIDERDATIAERDATIAELERMLAAATEPGGT